VLADAVLEAPKVGIELGRPFGGEAVDDPIAFAPSLDKSADPQVGQVLRDLHLALLQHCLKMADAQRSGIEEIEDSEPGPVAQALVDLDEFHVRRIYL
jgi:hypothetical protein